MGDGEGRGRREERGPRLVCMHTSVCMRLGGCGDAGIKTVGLRREGSSMDRAELCSVQVSITGTME